MAADLPETTTPDPLPETLRPSSSSQDVILRTATPLEYAQTCHLNSGEWRGPLSLNQYIAREQHLTKLDLTRGTATAWILTSEKLPLNHDGSRPILAACETVLKQAYVAKDGKVQKILTHGIGSVYCRPEYRGRGYAGRMIVEIGKALETYQQPNGTKGAFSVLYSDIGTKFYSQRGWKVFPSTHIHLLPVNQSTYTRITQKAGLPTLKDLQSSDLPSIPTVSQLEQELSSLSKTRPSTPHVAIRPDSAHFQWHHAREEIQITALNIPGGIPTTKGAIHPRTGTALVWSRVYAAKEAENQLHILRTVIDPSRSAEEPEIQKALASLLLRAQLEAGKTNMYNGIEVWSPSEAVVRAAQSLRDADGGEEKRVEVVSRDKEHVCSLRWIGGPEDEEVVWVANEKFAWC